MSRLLKDKGISSMRRMTGAFIPADDPRESAAVREVDLQKKYYLSAADLATRLDLCGTHGLLLSTPQQPAVKDSTAPNAAQESNLPTHGLHALADFEVRWVTGAGGRRTRLRR